MRTCARNAPAQQQERLLTSAALGTVYVSARWRVPGGSFLEPLCPICHRLAPGLLELGDGDVALGVVRLRVSGSPETLRASTDRLRQCSPTVPGSRPLDPCHIQTGFLQTIAPVHLRNTSLEGFLDCTGQTGLPAFLHQLPPPFVQSLVLWADYFLRLLDRLLRQRRTKLRNIGGVRPEPAFPEPRPYRLPDRRLFVGLEHQKPRRPQLAVIGVGVVGSENSQQFKQVVNILSCHLRSFPGGGGTALAVGWVHQFFVYLSSPVDVPPPSSV